MEKRTRTRTLEPPSKLPSEIASELPEISCRTYTVKGRTYLRARDGRDGSLCQLGPYSIEVLLLAGLLIITVVNHRAHRYYRKLMADGVVSKKTRYLEGAILTIAVKNLGGRSEGWAGRLLVNLRLGPNARQVDPVLLQVSRNLQHRGIRLLEGPPVSLQWSDEDPTIQRIAVRENGDREGLEGQEVEDRIEDRIEDLDTDALVEVDEADEVALVAVSHHRNTRTFEILLDDGHTPWRVQIKVEDLQLLRATGHGART